jgi:hypothetical protein
MQRKIQISDIIDALLVIIQVHDSDDFIFDHQRDGDKKFTGEERIPPPPEITRGRKILLKYISSGIHGLLHNRGIILI